ncbi:peptide-methionine (S)-S-oxide reductase [Maribacter sp. CXY002]|uniref:peptide-methionine (S)-S-oxide reductase n=1 Tax=Maribacter luteocoastalis TaxID=3407671 RepID=UPI003B673AED
MGKENSIALGGGCHWCTEAIFMSLNGISKVEQGFVAAKDDPDRFSEGVIVHYVEEVISLKDVIAIHLRTHHSTANHTMRQKYRSAIYTLNANDFKRSVEILKSEQLEFSKPIITEVLTFGNFRASDREFRNYYYKDIDKPFCKTYITPKLVFLRQHYAKHLTD